MAFGQSIIVAYVASEAAGFVAEQLNASPKNIRITKCAVGVGAGTITAVITADPLGAVGTIVMGTAYLGGHDPFFLVTQAIGSLADAKFKKSGTTS